MLQACGHSRAKRIAGEGRRQIAGGGEAPGMQHAVRHVKQMVIARAGIRRRMSRHGKRGRGYITVSVILPPSFQKIPTCHGVSS